MKKIYYILVVLALLFVVGCGKDRSHATSGYKSLGDGVKWIYDTDSGKVMVKNNFVYIPGGFDVDGDGYPESGFWLAKYEAKELNEIVDTNLSENVKLIENSFKVYNGVTKAFDSVLDLNLDNQVDKIKSVINSVRVDFQENGSIANNVSPVEALIALKNSQIKGGLKISLPTEKEWMQVVKLVVNNPKNWTKHEVGKGKLYQGNMSTGSDKRSFVIENSLLGVDENVPKNYSTEVYDLSGNFAEWTSGIVTLVEQVDVKKDLQTPSLWETKVVDPIKNVGVGGVQTSSHYVAIARGGSKYDLPSKVGINAINLKYGLFDKDKSISFRAASSYLY